MARAGREGFAAAWGLLRVYRAEAECRLRVDGSRLRTDPWGLAGGLPGGRAGFDFGGRSFVGGNGSLRAGDVAEVITAGAGGYGPPAARAREAVARDVAEHRLTRDAACAIYGDSSPLRPLGRRGS